MAQPVFPSHLKGLTTEEAAALQKKYGPNIPEVSAESGWWTILKSIVKEPMIVILLVVTILYFITGSTGEAGFMIGAIILVTGISFYQDNRSRKALQALQALRTPKSTVLRDDTLQQIDTIHLVPGDIVLAEEGGYINADGTIVYSHDFSVNESSLTGESAAVIKSESSPEKQVYSGTLVSTGMVIYVVENTGTATRIGQIGQSIFDAGEEPSPLQSQIESFVRKMAVAGIIVFIIVCTVYFLETRDWLNSLMKGLTLAMSILPEEIPVAFTTFMALGARKLIQQGILVKKTRTVETLGSATVICTDKTGTITENKMEFAGCYVFKNDTFYTELNDGDPALRQFIEAAMWASEPMPFDPMEKTIHALYSKSTDKDLRHDFKMVHEYPLGGVPPFMTHVFENDTKTRIIAAKGAPEALIAQSNLREDEKNKVSEVLSNLAIKGFRILGVGQALDPQQALPEIQQDIRFQFLGFIAFIDPVKANIKNVFSDFYEAGIKIKIITGDNPVTTKAIARQAQFKDYNHEITGQDVVKLNPDQLSETVKTMNVFTRMFPEAKMAVVNALRRNKETVAMIGDGVNDGPALKAADIGIAMGKKGTEVARNAADLVLLEDDLSKLVSAIATGRRIYSNLKKAVQYIVSIHIPIIMMVSLPVILGWMYPEVFTPVHVIFLELLMGPTCSIVFENEPLEKNAMNQPPRSPSETFLSLREMIQSIIQGLMITAGLIFIYLNCIRSNYSLEETRTMVFVALISANIFLTLTNRSFYYSFLRTLTYRNGLMAFMLILTIATLVIILLIPQVRSFFKLTQLHINDLMSAILTGMISVFWFEIWKWIRRIRKNIFSVKTPSTHIVF